MAVIFCRFDNGIRTHCEGEDERIRGFVLGLALAAMTYGFRVWVADSLPDDTGVDNDSWLSPEAWVDREAGL